MWCSLNAKPPMVFEGLENSRPICQLGKKRTAYFGFVNKYPENAEKIENEIYSLTFEG
jgi:hypothetical protein